jgi:predicted type IV restriction endonuclease
MPAPQTVLTLVENFERNIDAYRNGQYNETQVRLDFINPFFKALGWDMDNSLGYAEAYRDVIHEDAIKVGISTRAPDYSFRVGGQRKFFLEAKKPSVNVKDDVEPAFQLRRYAWSAKLPLSIVTDFEEFAIYDCRQKPDKNDKASKSRLFYCTFRDYAEKWDEIAAIFSKDAVLKGSFDRYAVTTKGKRGTTEVDSAFLEEIENWRNDLAHNIALRNANLTQRDLNFAVQQTIDRIIFLRICEDRGIEPNDRLKALQNGANVYGRLRDLFRAADDRYNSGLFHFKREKGREEAPDELTLNLVIDDKPLKEIFKNLYYPDCPYVFSVFGADILGSVYEQFLGKVIRLTAGNRAVVEDKPEVKKAGGVYYTPTYIVDYIVAHTVGKLLEGKSVKQAAGITVLDPACGSGSFLIGAYQYLLNWYLKQYLEDADKHSKGKSARLYQGASGAWRLTTAEKKRILLEHIYGVDIDTQAVEVTKLSLLLKVLEGESGQTLNAQMKLFHERVLPDLAHNIQCGNSLIGPDFYDGQLDLDDEAVRRINAFDWQAAFQQVFEAGGFDAVIGNPPWGATFTEVELNSLRKSYEVAIASNVDSYAVFIEAAYACLKKKGLLGFIVPDTFLRKSDYLPLRRFFIEKTIVRELIETGPVFSQVRDTWCLVFTIEKGKLSKDSLIRHRKLSRFIVSAEERLTKFGAGSWDVETLVPQLLWANRHDYIIGYLATTQAQNLISKIEKFPQLKMHHDSFRISRGEEGSKFALTEMASGNFFMLTPAEIGLYETAQGLRISEKSLTKNKIESFYKHPKIWIIRIQKMRWVKRIVSCFDGRSNTSGMKTLQVIVSVTDDENELKYLQALLASKLINHWCVNYLADDMNQSYLERLPIKMVDASNTHDQSRFEQIVMLVDKMLSLHQQLASAKTPQDTTLLQRQIDATDQQIDQLVYALYGLTEEEIALVETI